MIAYLLAWAVFLSPYSAPEEEAVVEYHPAAFFHENACGGRECNVWGWYDYNHVLYVREECQDNPAHLCQEMLLHELVHWLQHLENGAVDEHDCDEYLARELEAYYIQQEFRLRILGGFPKPAPIMGCRT